MKDDREGEIRVTERIANVLLKEESSGGSRARLCLDRGSVDVEYLQDCCRRQRVSDTVEGSTKDGPWLQDLILESELVLRRPTPRIRSPELEARLAELQKKREEREYNKLVKVAGHALGEKKREWNDPFEFEGNAGLVTYKQQLGFGMSVITLMGTLFLVGYKAAKHLTEDPSLVSCIHG